MATDHPRGLVLCGRVRWPQRNQRKWATRAGRDPVLALVLADELGMRPLVARSHLGLSKLYQRTGDRQQAQEHLTTATTMFREMGMTYWLKKAEVNITNH